MAKVAINGLGRVGRQVFKRMFDTFPELEIVATNDLFPNDQLAFLLKHDTNYGEWKRDIQVGDGYITIDGKKVIMLTERDPMNLPWGDLGVDIVIESTGVFRERAKTEMHLKAGAKKVIITAPAKGEDITIVLGVNDKLLDPAKHTIISNASCTTNSIAPVIKVLQDKFGIETGYLTTIHSYTIDQKLLDSPHKKDWRRARAAAANIVPTTTGAAQAVTLVIPELKGKLNGMAIRVPTPTVSITIFDAAMKKSVSAEEINTVMREAHNTYMKGILGYSEEPLVSMDYKGTTYSGIVDALTTKTITNFAHVASWYDNEWGYSCRVVDLTKLLANKAGF